MTLVLYTSLWKYVVDGQGLNNNGAKAYIYVWILSYCIKSVLICIECRNFHQTLDVYVLLAILIVQSFDRGCPTQIAKCK